MILMDSGADLSVTDGREQTPLHLLCRSTNTRTTDQAFLDSIRALILAGTDTQARDSEGRLPMEYLRAEDHRGRAIYEEAVAEMEYGDLMPVLK
jgi:hypothetical protein